MAFAKLSIDLEARLANFQAGMDKATFLLQKLEGNATTASRRVAEIFTGNFAANVATDALRQLVAYFPRVTDGVLAIKDLAEATGSSVETISALEDVARRSGDSLEEVESVIIKFNAALKEADGKNAISQALKALGLDAAELRKLDPAEAIQKAAQALNTFADDGNRARLTQELFGKGVKQAATFLRDLAEAGELNATVTTAQAEEVDKFNKQIASLNKNVEDLARTALGQLLPKVNEVFTRLTALRETYGSIGAGLVASTFDVKSFVDAGEGVAFYSDRVKTLGVEIDKLKRGGSIFDALNVKGKEKDLEAARKALEFYERVAVAGGNFAGGGRGFVNPPSAVAAPRLPDFIGGAAAAPKAASSFDSYSDSITRMVAALADKSPTAKLGELNAQLQRLDELASAGLDPKIVADVRAMLLPPQGANVGPPMSDELQRINELLKQTDSSQLAAAQLDLALINEELAKTPSGTARFSQLQDAALAIQERLTELAGTFGELQPIVDDSAKQMRESIDGALGSTLSAALRGEFNSIGDLWKSLLIDMAARALATDLTNALFGKKAGGGASFGWIDALAGVFGLTKSAKGNAFDGGRLVPFASGGVIDSPTFFRFGSGGQSLGVGGEAGTEGILPLKRGKDGKLGVNAAGMGGGVNIVQHITVQSGASRNEVMQAAATAKQAAVAEMQDLMRRGRLMPAGA